jgi:AraC-like DNA-binding protein
MTLVVRRPPPALAAVVRAITYQAGEQAETSRERILPEATASLWVNLHQDEFRSHGGAGGRTTRSAPGAILAGPGDRASVIELEKGRAHVWVTFALGGAAALFAAPLSATRNELAPLRDLWGADGARLRERLLEAATPDETLRVVEEALLEQVVGPLSPDPAILFAARALAAGAPVSAVSSELGMLPRTLRRRFLRHVGLTPKRFARVERLQRVVRSIGAGAGVSWAAVAAQHGYCDQAHLVDDFRDLVGVTPTEYLRHRVDGPNHLRLPGDDRLSALRGVLDEPDRVAPRIADGGEQPRRPVG